MVTAGSLRHVVEVWQPVDTVTLKGDTEISYVNSGADEYCSIEPLQGRELLFARQVRADVSHKISFRYRQDVTHRTQFRWTDGARIRKFELGPVVNQELRNVFVTVYAVEIQ